MTNNSKNENPHLKQLQRTVRSGLLSEFIFNSFLEFQQQRGDLQWNRNISTTPSPDKKLG